MPINLPMRAVTCRVGTESAYLNSETKQKKRKQNVYHYPRNSTRAACANLCTFSLFAQGYRTQRNQSLCIQSVRQDCDRQERKASLFNSRHSNCFRLNANLTINRRISDHVYKGSSKQDSQEAGQRWLHSANV